MTGFWIVAALITAGVVVLLALPLMRRAKAVPSAGGTDLAVYRDQLAELERDRARGLIEPEQAASLEAEIGRRMLTASRTATTVPAHAAPARLLAFALSVAVPVSAIMIYLAVGHPELPAQPLAERTDTQGFDPAKILAAVEQLKAKLKPVKEDLDGWVTVAQTYGRLGRPREGVEALRTAVSLAPDDATLSAALAEMLIEADGGAVGEEAKQRFRVVPDDSPARPEARYYLALADAQAGNMKAALAGWQSLLADSPADAPWIDATRDRIAAAAHALNLDPAAETPQPRPAAKQAGPSAADVDAVAKMTPAERTQLVRGMVDKLAAELQVNPDNAEGWRRLAQAYQVLGEPDNAKDALAHAEAAEHKAVRTP